MNIPFDYFLHHFNTKNFTLVMTILVRNEADIIKANISTHAQLGVDAFVVMDNGSTDGTREILESLKESYAIKIIDQPNLEYKQKVWMTQLAFEAKRTFYADWVINNDADEFWIPKNHTDLKAFLSHKGSVLKIKRTNMVPSVESLTDKNALKDFSYEVINPILYNHPDFEHMSTILTKIGAKTIINPHGLIKINTGNHSAEHIAFWNNKTSDDIHIYHYPIRSYAQFEQNILNRKQLLENIPNVRMGNHYRRWVNILNENRLQEEYAKFLFDQNQITFLEKIGILQLNTLPKEIINFDA